MMVEAGAKILPEDVMAEAILFGHRSLEPILDLQDQLREAVGKPKRTPFLEAGTDSVIDFLDAVKADKPFVVFDLETTSRDVKLGEIVEIGAVKVKGGKITDRWSTLVKPVAPIIGRAAPRHHGQGRRQGAQRRRGGEELRRLGRRRAARRPQRRLRPGLPPRRADRRHAHRGRAATWTP